MRFRPLLPCALLAAAALFAAAPCGAQPAPSADDRAQARQSFHDGVAAYNRADFPGALAAFQHAYALAPHPVVRVNIANCYVELHRPVEAIEHFERFLAESAVVPPAQRQQITRRIAELRAQVAVVHMQLPPDAEATALVTVDGQVVTHGLVRLLPGSHTVQASADGFHALRSELTTTAGAEVTFNVDLRPIAAPSPAVAPVAVASHVDGAPTATTDAAPEPRAPSHADGQGFIAEPPSPPAVPRDRPASHAGIAPGYFYAGTVVTAAMLVTTVALGAAALVSNGTFNDAANQIQQGTGDLVMLQQSGHDAAATARSEALGTDVCIGVTSGLALLTVILATQTDFQSNRVVVAPVARGDGAGLVVGGRF